MNKCKIDMLEQEVRFDLGKNCTIKAKAWSPAERKHNALSLSPNS